MSVSNPQQYLNDLGGFRNQIGNKVEAYKNKQDLVNLGVGKLKSKALQKAQDLMKQGQNLVNTAYESQGGAAAAGVLAKGGKKAASFVKGKIQERIAQRAGIGNEEQQGVEMKIPGKPRYGDQEQAMKNRDAGREGNDDGPSEGQSSAMDKDFEQDMKQSGANDGGGETKAAETAETPGAGETEGGSAGGSSAEGKVETESDNVVNTAANDGTKLLGAAADDEVIDDVAAATSWIPIVGEIFAGAAAAAGIGVGIAGIVEEAQGGDAEKKAENMTDTAPKAAAVNVAGTYVTPTRSSLMV